MHDAGKFSGPRLEACDTRAPQRGDSAASTFAGRMEQSCVVAPGEKHGFRGLAGGGGFHSRPIRGEREVAGLWGRRFTLV